MDASEVAACWEANAETWTRHARAGCDRYRDEVNTPVFLANLPRVAGSSGLDIGCGEGFNTRKLAELGAAMTGIDIAPTFIRHAQEAEAVQPLGIAYQVGDGMALPFANESFDFATAFMSLMDMPEQHRVLAEARRVLKPGGFLQFSILHPCFSPPYRKVLRESDGTVRAIEVGGYFGAVQGDVETWRFGTAPEHEKAKVEPFRVPRFHRTLSEWLNLIVATGFSIEHVAEPTVDAATAEAVPYLADLRIGPLFLHLRVRKPARA